MCIHLRNQNLERDKLSFIRVLTKKEADMEITYPPQDEHRKLTQNNVRTLQIKRIISTALMMMKPGAITQQISKLAGTHRAVEDQT